MDTSEIIRLYTVDKLSVIEIAKQYQTYTNKIRRILKKANVNIRDKSEAQKLAIETGRSKCPTKGIPMPEEKKIKLAKKLHDVWQKKTHEQKKRKTKVCQELWRNKTLQEQNEFRDKSFHKILETSKKGSKIELYLVDKLQEAGYYIIHHKKHLFGNDEMEIDILMPSEKIVIEVDGPSHYLPIYGEERFEKRQQADNLKSGQVINAGWTMIRVGVLIKNANVYYKNLAFERTLDTIQRIKSGEITDKFIEVKIEDGKL